MKNITKERAIQILVMAAVRAYAIGLNAGDESDGFPYDILTRKDGSSEKIYEVLATNIVKLYS